MHFAGGNIRPSRFVTLETTDYTVTESDSGETPFGISDAYGKDAPIPSISTEYVAETGEPVPIIGPYEKPRFGEAALLVLGSGGATCADFLKPDNEGAGVTASSTDVAGAIALEDGAAGEAIRVRVIGPYVLP